MGPAGWGPEGRSSRGTPPVEKPPRRAGPGPPPPPPPPRRVSSPPRAGPKRLRCPTPARRTEPMAPPAVGLCPRPLPPSAPGSAVPPHRPPSR